MRARDAMHLRDGGGGTARDAGEAGLNARWVPGECGDGFSRINTKGNALKRSPWVLPLGCSFRYFFFAVFLTAFLTAAFFAGAFLATFLVAICLFSLFDGLHRSCNLETAVEECIDSRIIDVKKKRREGKKKINMALGESSASEEVGRRNPQQRSQCRCAHCISSAKAKVEALSIDALSTRLQRAPAIGECDQFAEMQRLPIARRHAQRGARSAR